MVSAARCCRPPRRRRSTAAPRSCALEVNPDNAPAVALYRSAGYVDFGIYHGYYEDDSDALRMEHALVPRLQPIAWRVPHYRQTLEFTCGSAA